MATEFLQKCQPLARNAPTQGGLRLMLVQSSQILSDPGQRCDKLGHLLFREKDWEK